MTEEGGVPIRVLVVEDEMMVAMLVEDFLEELGHQIVGPASDLDKALVMAKEEAIDFAVLDVNLNGRETYPVADILSERGVPFVFASGYGARGLAEQFRDFPSLAKPFQRDDLERAIAKALRPGPAA